MSGGSQVTTRDLELVAALAEGRLEGRERAEAVARIERDPVLRELYAETLACLEEEIGAEALPPAAQERRPWLLPLAAVLALAVVGLPLWRTHLAPLDLDASSLAAQAAVEPERLAEGWYEPGWAVTRGPEAEVPGADLAFRLGVRSIDLETALDAGAVQDAIVLTHRLEGLLETVDFSEPQRQAYRQVRAIVAREGVVPEVHEYTAVADELNGENDGISADSYRLGKWAEAGRLALAAGDAAAVRGAGYRRGGRELEASDDERAQRLAAVRAALDGDVSPERLAEAFDALMRAH
ncbi:MAG: hypothetical protein R2991_07370 [Thermoanaerobaculia bacterium]